MTTELKHHLTLDVAVDHGRQFGGGLSQRCQLWLISFALWCGLGWSVGWILDAVLWHVSFNYQFAPHEFVNRFSSWSVAAATVVAAAATWGNRPVASVVSLLRSGILCFLVVCVFSATWAFASAALTGNEPSSTAHLAPLRRVSFCQGLWLGASWGFAVGTLGAVVTVSRRRRNAMIEIQTSSAFLTGDSDI
jgi:hypothetical protein